MANINTSVQTIEMGIAIAIKYRDRLQANIEKVKRDYQSAGSNGWNDKQYQNLGQVVNECASSMEKSKAAVEKTIASLKKLKIAAQNYEG